MNANAKAAADAAWAKPDKEPRFRLTRFEDVKLATMPAYLIKDLLPREGLTVVWGPPKSGKSFWIFDATMHIALGRAYRGRKVLKGPVLYVACEGERGIGSRLEAFRQRHLSEDASVPFYLLATRLDLIAEHRQLIGDIRHQVGEAIPVAIIIDTINRSLVGSENSDEDMGAYIKASDAIREAFRCAVVLVHHCGVEGTRPRGHTSLSGAVDCQIAVRREGKQVVAEVQFQKDGPSGELIRSTLETIEVGLDDEGDPITSCVVAEAEGPEPGECKPGLTRNQASMFSILKAAGPAGLTVDEWNDRARAEGLGIKRRTDLYDSRIVLKGKRMIYQSGDHWIAAP